MCATLADQRVRLRTLIGIFQVVVEIVIGVVRYVVVVIIVLVGVAFVTLIEQKILAGAQIRVGPNLTGY